MTDYNSYSMDRKETLSFFLFFISGLLIAGDLFYNLSWAGLLFLPAAKPLKKECCCFLAARRRQKLLCQFRDLLYSLSASVAAGHPMRNALAEAGSNLSLIYPEDALLCMELQAMERRMRESAESEGTLLEEFAFRSGIREICDFSDVYTICRQTGGNLEAAILKASGILMDKIDFTREVAAVTAQKRLEVQILIAMPLILLSALKLISPGYLTPLYQGATGTILMSLCLCAMAGAMIWCIRLTAIEL